MMNNPSSKPESWAEQRAIERRAFAVAPGLAVPDRATLPAPKPRRPLSDSIKNPSAGGLIVAALASFRAPRLASAPVHGLALFDWTPCTEAGIRNGPGCCARQRGKAPSHAADHFGPSSDTEKNRMKLTWKKVVVVVVTIWLIYTLSPLLNAAVWLGSTVAVPRCDSAFAVIAVREADKAGRPRECLPPEDWPRAQP
jgi:hypothetical protein